MLFSVHCQWGSWEAWSSCGTDCSAADGTGDQTRTRSSTAASNGGTACNANDGTDTQSCSIECPGNKIMLFGNLVTKLHFFTVDCQWGSWEPWSSCGTACTAANGTGDQIRTRTSTAATNGGTCNAADGSETQSCSVECPGNEIRWTQ